MIGNDGISFTLANPFSLRDYDFDISDSAKSLLKIGDGKELSVLNIIVIQSPIDNSVINFLAPIIVNKKDNIVGQVILDSKKYPQYDISEKISKYINK